MLSDHQKDSIKFIAVIQEIPEAERSHAWAIAHKQGLPAAIAFCHRKILTPC
jgi:hypothetical protein